jgi:hypothetical protein
LDVLTGRCECLAGFSRLTDNDACGLEGVELCTGLINATECEYCLPNTTDWFGGCKRCKENFFLQPSEEACMAKCPTGFTENGEPRRQCIRDGDIGDIVLSVNFNDNETQWPFLAQFNGRFEGPVLVGRHPVLLPNRGLYFDGHDDFMRMYDIRLNFQMTIHAWVYVFGDHGHLFSLETASPCNKLLCGDNELAVKFANVDGPKIFGRWDEEDSHGADASGFINFWKILAFRFEDFDASGAT